jgi:kynureninase
MDETQMMINFTALISQYNAAKGAGHAKIEVLDDRWCSLQVKQYDQRTGIEQWKHLGNIMPEKIADVISAKQTEIDNIVALRDEMSAKIASVQNEK